MYGITRSHENERSLNYCEGIKQLKNMATQSKPNEKEVSSGNGKKCDDNEIRTGQIEVT